MKKILKNLKEHWSRYFFWLYPLWWSILFMYITIGQNKWDILPWVLISIFFLALAIIFFSPNKRYNYILSSFLFILFGISVWMECLKTCTTESSYWGSMPWSILGFLIGGFLIWKYYGIWLVEYYKFYKKIFLSDFFIGLLKIIGWILVIGIIWLIIYWLAWVIAWISATTIIIILLVLILMKE